MTFIDKFSVSPIKKVKKDMPKCPECKSNLKVRKEGRVFRKTLPPTQRYGCMVCNRFFMDSF